jgi:hypothetical protein
MARVTVTNNVAGTYLIPSPISKKIAQNVTTVYDGIMAADLEKSHAFHQAISDGSITVVVADDPNMPNELEISPLGELADRGANLRTEEFTNPVVADANGIKVNIASTATNRTLGVLEMVPPRTMTLTTAANVHCTAVGIVYVGTIRNEAGELVPQTDTITATNGGGDAAKEGVKPFSFVTSIYVPAMGGGNSSLDFGFGVGIGLKAKVKSRAGLIRPLRCIYDGSVVTNGTFTNPTGSAVALYVPNTAPNGAHDYCVTYEVG